MSYDSWIGAFFFFLPAGLANMAPVLANKIPGWNRWNLPLDFGKTWHGQAIFGKNKTWRGLISGILFAGMIAAIEAQWIYHVWTGSLLKFVLVSMLMGFGALLGDAFESLIKRRVGIPPGQSWFPFDQTDYIIGGLLAVSPFLSWDPVFIGKVFVLYFGLHLSTVFIAYKLGLKDKPI